MTDAGSRSVRLEGATRIVAALVAGSFVLVVADTHERGALSMAAPASAQSVAPWTWTPPPPARPVEPPVVPPAPASADRTAAPPRAKRPSPPPGTSPTPERTLDSVVRPAPAPVRVAPPAPARGGGDAREDGSAAIDWLLKE